MALKGDLASVDLAQVFQMLALNQKVGILSVQGPGVGKALYFDQRGVTIYFNDHLLLDKVLANMVRTGQLQAETVRECREHATSQAIPVVDALLAGGFVEEADLEATFRHEIEEEVYDLFFWRDARFEFFEGATSLEGREGSINGRFFFSTDSLIMEAARRIDEWAFVKERVTSVAEVFRATENQSRVLELDDSALAVLELVDGKRNVQRLTEITGLPTFYVYKSLAQLLDAGAIQSVPAGSLVPAAKECIAEGRIQDAINLCERAIVLEQGLPDTHVLVAQAYEAAQEYAMAARHIKCVAEHYVTAGNRAQGVELLRHVVKMMPTDLAARERIVELTVGVAERKEDSAMVFAEAKLLVDLYVEIGELERVRSILERLLLDHPNDIEIKKSLINVHTKAGDNKRVIELYEAIADDLARRNDPIEAVKYLQKILMIDRLRRDVSERIRSLYEIDERRRSRRRAMGVAVVLAGLAVALGCAWLLYDQHARTRFAVIDVERQLAAGDFDGATAIYNSFVESHPFTLVAKEARAEIARIDGLRVAREAQLQLQRLESDAQKGRERTRYRAAWDRSQNALKEQNLEAALEHLEECRKLVAELGDDIDDRWAARVQLEKSVQDLRNYMGTAMALERSAGELLAANDWMQAREQLLELTSHYDLAQVAKRVRLPVMITSRPAGAILCRAGQPLHKVVDGVEVPLQTPVLFFCQVRQAEELELRLDGFEPRRVVVVGRDAAVSHHVLTVVPDARIDFEVQVRSSCGIGGTDRRYLAVGLRGGRVGVAFADGSARLATFQLKDLRELVGTPAVWRDRFVFRTNEPELVCSGFDGQPRFVAGLDALAASDPVVASGRVFVFDTKNRLLGLDLETGKELWRSALPATALGKPVVADRHVRVVTADGELLMLDVIDGSVVRRHSDLPGFSSSPLLADGSVIAATQDGHLVAIDEASGKIRWSAATGGVVRDGEFCVGADSVFVVSEAQGLLRLSLQDGVQQKLLPLSHRVISGPVLVQDRVFVCVRERIDEKSAQDVLYAIEASSFEIAWEFRDNGQFNGGLSVDGDAVYLPDSTTRVLRFR